MTNHRNGKTTGAVKGSFDRCEFKNKCESRFDKHFGHDRDVKDTFEYRNVMKNGTPEEMRKQAERLVRQQQERERNNPINKLIEAGKEAKEREKERSRQPLQSGQQPEQARPQSAQLEEGHSRSRRIEDDITDQKRKKNRNKDIPFSF
ncbi:mobB domain protein [Bacteroides fragilis str. 3397 N3]|nr:mobB domain protein [Bacteroides fragilis str. 3397 N3]